MLNGRIETIITEVDITVMLLTSLSRLLMTGCCFGIAFIAWAEDSKLTFPAPEWAKIRPEKVGYSSEKLEVLRAWLKTQKTTAMHVSVSGQEIFEYGDLKRVSKVASVRKSVLAMLYGKYFAEGKIDKPRMKAAELAAQQEISSLKHLYRDTGWDEAVGSSGTARSIENILRENELAEEGITREGLEKLRSLLIKSERADPDRIAGLRSNRAPVLPGGVAILGAVLDELDIEKMRVSEGALRHGVLYDLLGRVQHRDMREATVAQFMRRYHVDAAQAERIRSLSLVIYDALSPGVDREDDADRLMLQWAARLAEVGLSIEHADYHKHSAYVLSNADMPGFSRMEQANLARLVLAHRGKLGKVQEGFEGDDWKAVFALRIASLILRSRTDARLPFLRVAADEAGFAIDLPQSWLDDNALSAAALDAEADYWKKIGMRLEVSGLTDKKVSVLKQVR